MAKAGSVAGAEEVSAAVALSLLLLMMWTIPGLLCPLGSRTLAGRGRCRPRRSCRRKSSRRRHLKEQREMVGSGVEMAHPRFYFILKCRNTEVFLPVGRLVVKFRPSESKLDLSSC